MKKLLMMINNQLIPIYLASLFLSHTPYYYLLPGKIIFLNSYFIARFLTLIVFLTIMLLPTLKNQRKKIMSDRTGLFLIILLVGQSLSIINADNSIAFLKSFEQLFFGVMFYFNTLFFFYKKRKKGVQLFILFLVLSTTISLIDELLIFLNSQQYLKFAEEMLYYSQVDFIKTNLFRNRLFLNKYNEVIIPLLFYLLINKKQKRENKISLFFLIILTGILSLLSGWRTRLLAYILGFLGSSLIIGKKKLLIVWISVLVFITLYSSHIYMKNNYNFSTYTRLIFEDKADYLTLISRFEFYQRAIDFFTNSPIFGIGLSHFSLTNNIQKTISLFKERKMEVELTESSAHSIFFKFLSETGLVGTIPFFAFLYYIIKKDYQLFFTQQNKEKALKKIAALSFWILFFFAFTGSETSFHFYSLIFGIRVLRNNVF